jgi:hypothetical protein
VNTSKLAEALALLQAGDWQSAHVIAQEDDDDPLACWAHGIVHALEGDAGNARYWYGRARRPFPEPYRVDAEIQALEAALREPSK